MHSDENIDIKDWDSRCIVCGKSVDGGGGMCHIKVENLMIALCCPLCVETYNNYPKHYLQLREIRQINAPGSSAGP